MPARKGPRFRRGSPPFRIFFILGSLDAVLGVIVWGPGWLGGSGPGPSGVSTAAWHARELLFGAFPMVMSGFLLTALPRWTGRPLGRVPLVGALPALWLAGPASALLYPAMRPALAAGYLAILAVIVGHQILGSGRRREVKILLLVTLLAGAATLDALALFEAPERPFRIGIAAMLGLIMVLGGRILPSLTEVYLGRRGRPGFTAQSPALEAAAAATAVAALSSWVLAPDTPPTAWLSLAASASQAARYLRWRPWRAAGFPPLLALHVAYGCVPLGFALLATPIPFPGSELSGAALHVWAIGAIGTMSVAVMASMIRRHSDRPFARSAALNLAFFLLGAALVARWAADHIEPGARLLILGAIGAWVGAHILFLAGSARDLLLGPTTARCRPG